MLEQIGSVENIPKSVLRKVVDRIAQIAPAARGAGGAGVLDVLIVGAGPAGLRVRRGRPHQHADLGRSARQRVFRLHGDRDDADRIGKRHRAGRP